jgi:LacI family transcriptional regulator
MAVTLKDVARIAGVTEASVSLALSGNGNISPVTRQRIRRIAGDMGYSPNAKARQLALKKTQTIGVVVPDIENPYYGKMVKEITRQCKAYGYKVVIADSGEDAETEVRIISDFVSERVEGILIAPINHTISGTSYINSLRKYDVRYCFIAAYPPDLKCPYVMMDLEKGSYLLVNHLLDHGQRKIYFLLGSGKNLATSTRLAGYRRAFREHGLRVNQKCLIYCDSYTFDSAYRATMELIDSQTAVDAIITLNDIMALGSLRALIEKNIAVPEDISIAGYDDVVFAGISTIPLSTVRQDVVGIAENGVKMLMDMIGSEQDDSRHILLEPELVLRSSTR